jgi:NAD(P)H-flavin reductase
VLTMTQDEGWEGESRYVSAEMLSDYLERELADYTYLVAGPPALVEAVVGQLGAAGVPEEQVLPDSFSGY